MRLLYFNPENDLALAANDPHYTPPASALQMATDLQRLPLRWAKEGDIILLRDGKIEIKDERLKIRNERLEMKDRQAQPSLISHLQSLISHLSSLISPLPWGWSPLVVRQFREAGVPNECLPTDEEMKAYRDYASRQTAVKLLVRLRDTWPEPFQSGELIGESRWCESEAEVMKAVNEYGDMAMLKAPWSGSGRGVHPVKGRLTDKDTSWIRRILQRQGGVEVEPFYQRIIDFAMEFWAEGGQVRYEGLSLFTTTDGGVYSGNIVASEEEKMRRLSPFVSPKFLSEVREHLLQLLSTSGIPTWYSGPLGIDMMVAKATNVKWSMVNGQWSMVNGQCSLHPLIEINLRMTMGWVALNL